MRSSLPLTVVMDSRVETSVRGADAAADAGDIDIRFRGDETNLVDPVTPELVVIDRSVVRANAVAAGAGNIGISGDAVFISTDSVIEATSEIGIDRDGDIVINAPDLDIVGQLAALPSDYVDPSDRLLPPCIARTERTGSFVVQTRDALARPPDAPLGALLVGESVALPGDALLCPAIQESP